MFMRKRFEEDIDQWKSRGYSDLNTRSDVYDGNYWNKIHTVSWHLPLLFLQSGQPTGLLFSTVPITTTTILTIFQSRIGRARQEHLISSGIPRSPPPFFNIGHLIWAAEAWSGEPHTEHFIRLLSPEVVTAFDFFFLNSSQMEWGLMLGASQELFHCLVLRKFRNFKTN
ncbi:hypothetical protein K501DRAFT_272537 [Backusella circina FSU 941]|nr:hypothetical protein K501DRAFT_272537 [Backusella circina FSU 941]